MLTENLTKQAATTGFVYPQYKSDCISNIPNTILQLFNTKKAQSDSPLTGRLNLDTKNINKIVLLVVDGFGFNRFLASYKQNPFLTNLTDAGTVFPLTSVYPSQTTNALTTLNTGLTPQEHGLFEYFIYLKEAGIVNALRFERIGTKKSKLIEQGFDPHLMYSGGNIQQRLQKEDIKTYTHMNESNAALACTKLVFEDSTIISAYKNSDAIVKLRKNIEQNKEGAYFFVHLETLDTISHEYGPESQSAWMEYVYMKQARPTNATGVPVTLNVVDPNGNYYTVGTATSDSNGAFRLAFTPEVTGAYTVVASFAGTGSFYGSSAETSIYVDTPAATATPQPTQAPSAADLYFIPAIAALFALGIITLVIVVLLMRKRP